MRRQFWRAAVPALAALVLVIGGILVQTVRHSVRTEGAEELDHEALVHYGTTACGVERWAVKTGTDAGARSINTSRATDTSISHLRLLTPPSYLPRHSRTTSVERTVWRLSGTLVRIKKEADSDYHLVLSDSGGRTMIVESPDPNCVGAGSPFIHQIRYVRRVLAGKFHPGDTWTRGRWPVTVTGVGFFDFQHGQSGVAPNAIELHPILSVRFGGASAPPPPPAPAPPSSTKPTANLSVSASVSPNPVAYGQYATLTARATPGASCSASVVYSTGRPPRSFDGYAQTVPASGSVSWSWHMESKGSSGTATVDCSLSGRSASASATFGIT